MASMVQTVEETGDRKTPGNRHVTLLRARCPIRESAGGFPVRIM